MPVGKVGHAVNGTVNKLNADLLVMGTTARKGVKGLVIGNSAERVLTKATSDILALKP
jgi:nucleotide-binding universal stress UspA family protein